MRNSYLPRVKGTGRRQTPEKWVSGPDPLNREKYYAFLKHKAQANYRNESYTLTWEEWLSVWPHDLWLQRGRRNDSLCLCMIDQDLGWHITNIEVIPRIDLLRRTIESTHAKSRL